MEKWRRNIERLRTFFTVEEAVKSIDIFTENMKKQEEEYLKNEVQKENVKNQVATVKIPSFVMRKYKRTKI